MRSRIFICLVFIMIIENGFSQDTTQMLLDLQNKAFVSFQQESAVNADNAYTWFNLACSLSLQCEANNSTNSIAFNEIAGALKKAAAIHEYWQLQIFTEPSLEYVREYPFDSKNEAGYGSATEDKAIVFSKDGFIYRVHHSATDRPREYESDIPEDSLVDHDTSEPDADLYIGETGVPYPGDEVELSYELLGFYTIINYQIFMYSIEDGFNSHFEWFPGAM